MLPRSDVASLQCMPIGLYIYKSNFLQTHCIVLGIVLSSWTTLADLLGGGGGRGNVAEKKKNKKMI